MKRHDEKGYKFNREEIYAERFGNVLNDLGKKNDDFSEREVKEDVSKAIAEVRKNTPR